MNFGQWVDMHFQTYAEDQVHPHTEEERAALFKAVTGGAAELEILTLLNALVYTTKPSQVLETGTGSGFGTLAIAAALEQNRLGHVHTIELDAEVQGKAKGFVAAVKPETYPFISWHQGDSQTLLGEWKGKPFDFVFFDTLIAFRHKEFEILASRGLLRDGALCVFHDTSRQRGSYYEDYNPEMIAALDRYSQGSQWLEFPLSRGLRMLRYDSKLHAMEG